MLKSPDGSASTKAIDNPKDYEACFRELCAECRRDLVIMAARPDPLIFNSAVIVEEISALTRRHAKARVRILISDTRDIARMRLQLIDLGKRLPSKIAIRKLTCELHSGNNDFAVGDRSGIFVKHGDDGCQGLYDASAPAEARNLLDEFNDLWERQSADIPDLMMLRL